VPDPPTGDVPSEFLAKRVVGGDADALARLYERIAPALFAWARLRIRSSARAIVDPEDVVQDVWVQALRGFRATYDPERESFRAWLFGIANHVLSDAFRRAKGRLGAGGPKATARPMEEIPEEVTTMTRRIARQEDLRRFIDQVRALPDEDRMLVIYRGLEGLPHRAAAERLGITPAAARKRWERLREKLAALAASASVLEVG